MIMSRVLEIRVKSFGLAWISSSAWQVEALSSTYSWRHSRVRRLSPSTQTLRLRGARTSGSTCPVTRGTRGTRWGSTPGWRSPPATATGTSGRGTAARRGAGAAGGTTAAASQTSMGGTSGPGRTAMKASSGTSTLMTTGPSNHRKWCCEKTKLSRISSYTYFTKYSQYCIANMFFVKPSINVRQLETTK